MLAVLDHPDRAPYVVAIDDAANDPLATEIGPMLDSTPDAPAAQMRSAQDAVADDRREPAPTGSRNDAATKQRNYLLAAVGAVALALLVLALANRWITKPLSRLADEARVMASERLPNAVNSILETPLGEDVVPPDDRTDPRARRRRGRRVPSRRSTPCRRARSVSRSSRSCCAGTSRTRS